MAAAALAAELAVVRIVLGVATSAILRQTEIADVGGRVTFRTGNACVRAEQREFGAPLVIEVPQRPTARAVAILASGAEPGFVSVVLGVAGRAIGRRVGKVLVLVTGLALHRLVGAQQRKTRLAVVETNLRPAFLGVALGARRAEPALVLVIFAVALDAIADRSAAHHAGVVAGIALRLAMLAEQLERGVPIVIEAALLPIGRGVAIGAGFPVAPLVGVVLAVAGDALALGVVIPGRRSVAFHAGGGTMGAVECEPSLGVIKARRRFPGSRVVAFRAISPESALVAVVGAMAGCAVLHQPFVRAGRLVTGIALGVEVLADQGESGAAMIEARAFPVLVFVAGSAVVAERAAVRIVLLVATAAAIVDRFFGGRLQVTGVAFDFRVLSAQRESGALMVETHRFPIRRGVALVACLAEFAFVAVVGLVAREAGRLCLAIFVSFGMTFHTVDLHMRSLQVEARRLVAECLGIEDDDVRVAPLVIGVATVAGAVVEPPVQAATGFEIASDVLMTGHAKRRLAGTIEGNMTVFALALPFRVRTDDFPRHECTFQDRRAGDGTGAANGRKHHKHRKQPKWISKRPVHAFNTCGPRSHGPPR